MDAVLVPDGVDVVATRRSLEHFRNFLVLKQRIADAATEDRLAQILRIDAQLAELDRRAEQN